MSALNLWCLLFLRAGGGASLPGGVPREGARPLARQKAGRARGVRAHVLCGGGGRGGFASHRTAAMPCGVEPLGWWYCTSLFNLYSVSPPVGWNVLVCLEKSRELRMLRMLDRNSCCSGGWCLRWCRAGETIRDLYVQRNFHFSFLIGLPKNMVLKTAVRKRSFLFNVHFYVFIKSWYYCYSSYWSTVVDRGHRRPFVRKGLGVTRKILSLGKNSN